MRAPYGIVTSKTGTITFFVVLILYVAILAYFAVSGEWVILTILTLNLGVFALSIHRRFTQYVQVTENDRLIIGSHTIDIREIHHLVFYDACTFRVHYSLEGNARISAKVQLKEADDKVKLLMILKKINPHIQIH